MSGKKGMKGDGLGGHRSNAGRPPKQVSVAVGAQYIAHTTTPEGRQVGLSELWTVIGITRNSITFANESGDVIITLRK